jgi:hypothetical protein
MKRNNTMTKKITLALLFCSSLVATSSYAVTNYVYNYHTKVCHYGHCHTQYYHYYKHCQYGRCWVDHSYYHYNYVR